MTPEDKQTCVIKEQGDLGLFADPVSEDEQKTIDENAENTGEQNR